METKKNFYIFLFCVIKKHLCHFSFVSKKVHIWVPELVTTISVQCPVQRLLQGRPPSLWHKGDG